MGPVFLLLAASTSAHGRPCMFAEGYIYDEGGAYTAHVVNLRDGFLSVQSQRWANVRSVADIGGPIRICSNGSFYCVGSSSMTAYNMIVPRSEAAGQWSFHGITCTTTSATFGRLAGECRSLGFVTSYVYERGRGLTSYTIADG